MDKILDNYEKIKGWYWVLSDPITDNPNKQAWQYLTFSKEKPAQVGNQSMKWQRPTLETLLDYSEGVKRDWYFKNFNIKGVVFNRDHPIYN